MSYMILDDSGAIKQQSGKPMMASDLQVEEKSIDKKKRIVEVAVSSDRQDRDGDRIVQEGIDRTHAHSVLYGHNYGRDGQLPIAKIVSSRLQKRNGYTVTYERHAFSPEGRNTLADEVWNAIEDGILASTSIGFIPKSVKRPMTDDERAKLGLGPNGVMFEAIEQLETSWVPVQSNRDAVLEALQRGIVSKDLFSFQDPPRHWLTLDEQAGGILEAILNETREEEAVKELIDRKIADRLPRVLSKAMADCVRYELGIVDPSSLKFKKMKSI